MATASSVDDVRNVSCEESDKAPCEVCVEKRDQGGAHQVKPLGAELEQELIQSRGSFCDEHKEKEVELYCFDCDENVCALCSAVKHKQHETAEIQEVAKTFASQIDSDGQQVLSQVRNIRNISKEKNEKRDEFLREADRVKSEIKARGKQVHEIIDKLIDMQLDEVDAITSEDAKKVEAVEESYQTALVAMESFHAHSREVLDKGGPSDVTRAAGELLKRATELLDNDVTSVQYCPTHMTFTPADVTQLKLSNVIGRLTLTAENQPAGGVLHTLPEGKRVWGVSLLDDLLYVLRDKSSIQVEVYDIRSHRFQRCFTVRGLRAMADMAACARNCCLYISGFTDKCVHRVSLPSVDVTKWPVNDKLTRLSVTDTHSVLAMCCEVRMIKEFTTHGKLLREIQLPQDVVSPKEAVQLPSGEFVVCHGDITDPVHRVCLVGSDGQVVKSYGGPRGSGSEQMNVPAHLAVDRNGFVFVADLNNYRVLLLSPALTYVREVVSRDQLKWKPLRLYLDDDRRRLYVAENVRDGHKHTAGRVVVISV